MLILDKFPTHIEKSDNKIKANSWWKINSQGIYNSSIQKFTRGIVVANMHKYILKELSTQKLPVITEPVQLILRFYIPINYGNVRRKKDGSITWKKPIEGYEPSADEDNVSWIWNKTIKDCLTKLNLWADDTMYWCRGTDSLVEFIEELEDRRIEIGFKKI